YGSVAGYEILNEPHLFNKAMYDKLGNYHTYMAKKMRAITDKKIYFDRETAWGFTRDPTLEHKIVPDGVSRLVYAVQAYAIPTSGSSGLKQMNNFKDWSQQWGTEVFICEMAPSTLSDAKTFLQVLKSYGFGWTAHAWRPYASPGLGESYYESSTVAATAPLKSLRAAMQEIYWG
ncbi:MAG: cellulase family glycosylhydrolase, partial [Nitrososphaera sp.]